jgi:hypothetical protein
MLSEPKWNFDLYLRAAREQRVAAGAHGWRLKLLPWMRNNPVVKQLEVHDSVVAAMLPSDRVDPANLGAEAKNRIAQRSGCTLQQVNSVIKQVCAARPCLCTAAAYFSSRSRVSLSRAGYGEPQYARLDAAAEGGRAPHPAEPRGHGEDRDAAGQLDEQGVHAAAVMTAIGCIVRRSM